MRIITQNAIKIPSPIIFKQLDGGEIKVYETGTLITVKSNKGNIYELPLSKRCKYNIDEILSIDAEVKAVVDTNTWEIIELYVEPESEIDYGIDELGGDY